MNDFLANKWIKVLVIAATIALGSFALRETASITQPLISALGEVLAPVAVAFALAYVVTPVVDAMTRIGINRMAAAGLLFGVGSLLLVGSLALLVPAIVRQSVDLSVRMVQGETYTDSNGNKRHDDGEPFNDTNGNRLRDAALITKFAGFLEEGQNRLRVAFGLGINEPSLAFLRIYDDETKLDRQWLDAMVLAARQGRPQAEWPALSGETPTPLPSDAPWSPAWPGPSQQQLDDVQAYVPASDRALWRQTVTACGSRLFHRHADLLGALNRAKDAKHPDGAEPLADRIRASWKKSLTVEQRRAASVFALELERQARDGSTSARDVLTAVDAAVPMPGQSAPLTEAMASIEQSLKGSVSDLPGRLGAWAKASVAGVDSLMTLALGLFLVPIYAFFLLLGMPKIRSFVKDYLPASHKEQVVRITRDIEKVVAAFFRGRLLICVICATIGCVGFLVIGLFGVVVPYGMLWGIGMGLATAIPLAGLLFLIPAIGLTLLQPGFGAVDIIAVIGVYAVVQGAEAALIPAIMGREVELHPVTLIVALLLCGKLLGVIGLVLAVPIAATARILLREYFWPRLRHWSEHGTWIAPPSTAPDHPRLP